LKEYVKWGKAKSVPLETLDEKRRHLREIIKNYDLNDVFNCNEIGKVNFLKTINYYLIFLFISGFKKKSKKQITLLFTCNAIGTEKLKPLFIYTYKNP
ncbi:hypothetical protein RhiirA1_330292, partial [Rhizophagus irregularis]